MTDVSGGPRHRRPVALALASVLTFGTLAACADNSAPSDPSAERDQGALARTVDPGAAQEDLGLDELTIGILGTAPTLNPLEDVASGLYINPLALESLLRVNPDGELEPWLASEWEQVSDTVYEYTLRDGVTFWDGTELTSEDVKFSWETRKEQGTPYFAGIESIETPDDSTVRVTLTEPDASWESTPAMFWGTIFQKKFYEENAETFGQPGTLLMGTGPWQVDSLSPTSGAQLSAYDDYWGGTPPIDKIEAKFFSEDNSMALAMRAGEIDFAPQVTQPAGFDSAAGGDTVTTTSTCATALISMPTTRAPWDEVEVRQAVAHAINREDLIAATQGRAGDPLDYLISPILLAPLGSEDEVEAALDSVPTYEHDVEKAREALADSSVPDGFEAEILTTATYAAVTEVIAAQLKEIGIDLSIRSVADAEYNAALFGPAEERPVTFTETGACSPDPSWDAIYLGDSVLNIASWTPGDIQPLLTQGLAEQDPAQRLDIYTEVLTRVGEEVPYVPVYEEGATYGSKEYGMADFGSYWVNGPWALNLVTK